MSMITGSPVTPGGISFGLPGMKTLTITPSDVSGYSLGTGSATADAEVFVSYDRAIEFDGGGYIPLGLRTPATPAAGGQWQVKVFPRDHASIVSGGDSSITVWLKVKPLRGGNGGHSRGQAIPVAIKTIQVFVADDDTLPLSAKANVLPVPEQAQSLDLAQVQKAVSAFNLATQAQADANNAKASAAASAAASANSATSAQSAANLVGAPAGDVIAAALPVQITGPNDLAPDYVYTREDMGVSCLGQDADGKLYGVSFANGHFMTSVDNGTTWTDRTYSPTTYGLGGMFELVFIGDWMFAQCPAKVYRAPKDTFNGWVDISPTDVPASTTGRPSNLSTDGTILMYGNYNAATYSDTGYTDYPRIWRCDNPTAATPSWSIVLTVPNARHVHSVIPDKRAPGVWWVAIGDSPNPGMGLYRSPDGTAGSFTRIGGNRYPINVKFPPAPANAGDPYWVLGEGDGQNQPHLIGIRRSYVPGGGPLEGMAWPTTEWKGTARGLYVDANGDAFYMTTAEGGAVGTQDGVWCARGPHYSEPVLLEKLATPFAAYMGTYESGDWLINFRYRMRKPRWRTRTVAKTAAYTPSPIRTPEGVQAPLPSRVVATTPPYDYPLGTTTGQVAGWVLAGVVGTVAGVLTTFRFATGATQTLTSTNSTTDARPVVYLRTSYQPVGADQQWGAWRRTVGGIEGAVATLAATQTIPATAQTTVSLAGVKLTGPSGTTWITGGGITIPTGYDGHYVVAGKASWAAAATAAGYREVNVNKNGSSIAVSRIAGAAVPLTQLSSTEAVLLAAGDVLTLAAFQTSGSPLDVSAGSTNTFLELRRVAAT